MFIFQPAEEVGAGLVLREGLFADFKPDAVFAPFSTAADSFRIVVKGSQAHDSRPWSDVGPIGASATPPCQDMSAVPTKHSLLFYLDEVALKLGTCAMLEKSLETLERP